MQLEGQIAEIDVVQRLVELHREKFTGAFRFEQDGVIKIIYFKNGDVLSASTNDRTDSIDEILLRAGKVSREHVKQALAKRKESETLGDALLNLGFITRKELTWARRVQVIGILRSIGAWREGSYTGVADYLPKREEGTLFPLPQIILELIVTDSDRAKFDAAMDGGAAVFARSSDFDESYRRLGLNEDADAIVAEVDGARSAADVAAVAGKDAFNVYKLLEALRALGVVQRVERTHGATELSFDDFAAAGVSDASEALVAAPPEEPAEGPMEAAQLQTSEPDFDWDAAPTWEPSGETPVAADVPLASPSPVIEPIEPLPPPLPAPPVEKPEPQWGFDEAQIETARRAAVPLRASGAGKMAPPMADTRKASKRGKTTGVILFLVLIVVVAFGGFEAWQWWQKRQTAAAPPAVAAQKPARRLPPTPAPVILHPSTTPPVGQVAAPALGVPPTLTATTATVITPGRAPVPVAAPPATTVRIAPPTATTAAGAKPAAVTAAPRATAAAPGAPATTRLERTTAGATITNSGATAAPAASPATRPAASDEALRAKYEAMAREHAVIQGGNYTVQFELVCETGSITKALAAGGSSVWFIPISYRGKSCYRVFWGRFDTREEALKASADIPKNLRDSLPVVVKIPR